MDSTGERLGRRLTNAEAFELMLETAVRAEPCPRGQAGPDEGVEDERAPAEAARRPSTSRTRDPTSQALIQILVRPYSDLAKEFAR